MTLTPEELKAMLDAEYERGKKEGEKVEVIRYYPVTTPPVQPPWTYPMYPIVTWCDTTGAKG